MINIIIIVIIVSINIIIIIVAIIILKNYYLNNYETIPFRINTLIYYLLK